jgi:eukaryotic-like serine/threonine-protein kinase
MPFVIGRYVLFDQIASGGMASVHLGRLVGSRGFTRTVAIKRMHAMFANEPDFVKMVLDEARLASRIRHPNVVPTLDVVAEGSEVCLVMEYVHALSLAQILHAYGRRKRVPPRLASAIVCGLLHGLHAAHEATDEAGEALGIVHRDVSPHNVLVGGDGIPRVLDFGIAKASGQLHTTREGVIKGKIAYMASEQLDGAPVDARTDVYSAAVVLWECVMGRRLFEAEHEAALLRPVLAGPDPSKLKIGLGAKVDAWVAACLSPQPRDRPASARAAALELERTIGVATATELGAWVEGVVGRELARRQELVQAVELRSMTEPDAPRPPASPSISDVTEIDPLPRGAIDRPDETKPTAVWQQPDTAASVSVARESLGRPARSDSKVIRMGAAVAGLAAVLGLVGWCAAGKAGHVASDRPVMSSVPPTTSSVSPAASSAMPAAPTESLVEPVEAVPAEIPPESESSPEAPPASTAPARRPRRRPRPQPPVEQQPQSQPPSCDPPWFVDSSGIRRIRPGCGASRAQP